MSEYKSVGSGDESIQLGSETQKHIDEELRFLFYAQFGRLHQSYCSVHLDFLLRFEIDRLEEQQSVDQDNHETQVD